MGADPGTAGGMSLRPMFHYLHPLASEPRTSNGVIDIGAYELGGSPPGPTPDSGAPLPGADAGPMMMTGKDATFSDDVLAPTSGSGCHCHVSRSRDPSLVLVLVLVLVLGPRLRSRAALAKALVVTAVGLAVIWGAACKSRKDQQASRPQVEWLDPAKLEPGPIVHATLKDSQVERIKTLQRTFADVDPTPVEKWVEDFQRDQHPEREIRIYEAMANAYRGYCEGRTLSPRARKDVYSVVLMRSGAPASMVLARVKLEELSQADAQEILKLYTDPPLPITVTPAAP
jgi:hypothetical protein